jgi:RHS repeat-associated protein
VATGTPPFGSFSGGPDVINNGNLNVHWNFPVVNKPGRGLPFNYNLKYDTSVWYPVASGSARTWQPVYNWGWSGWTATGYVSFNQITSYCTFYPPYGPPQSVPAKIVLNDFIYYDTWGVGHPFPGADAIFSNPGDGCPSGTSTWDTQAVATDGSGYIWNGQTWELTPPQGGSFSPPYQAPAGAASISDANGNTISNTSGGVFTDTLGVTALTVSGNGTQSSPMTFTYTGAGGSATVTVNYVSKTVRTNFGCSGISEFGPTTEYLVSEIDMPDIKTNPSDKYTFTYETTPGDTHNPHYVTGRLASVTLPTGGTITYKYLGGSNGITCVDGSAAALKRYTPDTGSNNYWQYAHSENGTAWTTTITDPQSNQTTMNFQTIYETERQVAGLETVITCYNNNPNPCTNASNTTAITLPITARTILATVGGLTSESNTTYNSYGLPTEVDQYAFGTSGAGGLVRKTLTTYNTSLNSLYIYDRPSNIQIQDSSSTAKAQSAYTYDGYGNPTQETRYTGGTPSTISRTFTPGSYGVLTAATDFNGNPTTYTNFTCANSTAFPQTISSGGLSTLLAWDSNCNGAVVTSVTDPNSKTTRYTYDTTDNIWRLAGTSFPDGGSTSITYTSATQVDLYTAITSSLTRHDQLDLDGLGRVATGILVNDPDPGGATYVATAYDSLGRLLSVSSPYRGSSNGGDTYAYDALNRINSVTHADSGAAYVYYGGAVSGAGGRSAQLCAVGTYGYGYPTLVKDENGKLRQLWTDALGRTIEVDEPDPATGSLTTGSVNGTCYTYDVLGNLSEIDQGSETRKYTYDMLSRVTSVTTPEAQNNTRYFYYTTASNALCSGNPTAVCRRTDERGVTTTYSYDSLNRPTGASYSNGDPAAISYTYDQTSCLGLSACYNKGRRTTMTDASGSTQWAYDAMGRVLIEQRTIGSVTKTLGYTYNLDGSLASVTYPSGRTVNYAVSGVGRPLTAIDTADNITYVGPANSTYAPQGALATASYGTNLTFSASYNNRLLPSDLKGYNTSTSTTIFELKPAYNANGTVSSVANAVTPGRTQTFAYDYLNRITSASSTATSGTYCWGQSVPTNGTGYDRYGNLLIINVSQCTAPTLNLSVNAYNQITNSGFSYDASGNMTGDGAYTYAWNGAGVLKSAGSTTYTYDGDDKRVEKSSGTYYWFSPSGSVLAETDTSGNTLNEYIYFSAGRTARRDSSGNVYYYFGDHLGTSRVIANSSGTVCYDADYTSFGYEMAYTTSCSQNYKFTGMERDTETGNDHAWFRNYEQNLGRWMSPDPLAGDITNPQSLNRYAYVLNNPTSLTDPPGLSGLKLYDPAPTESWDVFSVLDIATGGGSSDSETTYTYELDISADSSALVYEVLDPDTNLYIYVEDLVIPEYTEYWGKTEVGGTSLGSWGVLSALVPGFLAPMANGAMQAFKQAANGRPAPTPGPPLRPVPGPPPQVELEDPFWKWLFNMMSKWLRGGGLVPPGGAVPPSTMAVPVANPCLFPSFQQTQMCGGGGA